MTNGNAPAGLVGNGNYNLYSNCEVLTGVSVTIDVTEEIVAVPSAPSADGEQSNGIGFQFNCIPPASDKSTTWQQYTMVVSRTGQQLGWGIDNWHGANQLINTSGTLATIPSALPAGYARIPVGYRFVIELGTDAENNVDTVTYSAFDQNNVPLCPPKKVVMTAPGFLGFTGQQVTEADLGPIADVMLVIVGYSNGAATLIASGAGTITYEANNRLTAVGTWPTCINGVGTAESSNVTYADMSSEAATSLQQTFSHTTASACIVAQGPSESLDFYWQQIGDSDWNQETVAGAETTLTTPSIAFGASAVASWLAAQGAGNSLDFYWQPVGGSGWSPGTVAQSGSAFSMPSIAQIGNLIGIAVQGPNNSLMFYSQTIGTPEWNHETVAGADTTFSAPTLAVVGNSMCIVATGPQKSLKFYWQAIGGNPPWNPETIAGSQTTYSAPSIAQIGNSACVVAEGLDSKLDFYWQSIGGNGWNPETVAGGGLCASAPSLAQVGNSACVACQGPGKSLAFYWQTIGSAHWNPEVVAGANTTFSSPSLAQVGNAACIAVEGDASEIIFYWQQVGTAAWHAEKVASNATGPPVALTAIGPPLPPAGGWQ